MLAALNLLDELDGRKIKLCWVICLNLVPTNVRDMKWSECGPHRWRKFSSPLAPRTHDRRSRRRAGMKSSAIMEFEEIAPIIDWLKKNLNSNDAVLIKGPTDFAWIASLLLWRYARERHRLFPKPGGAGVRYDCHLGKSVVAHLAAFQAGGRSFALNSRKVTG